MSSWTDDARSLLQHFGELGEFLAPALAVDWTSTNAQLRQAVTMCHSCLGFFVDPRVAEWVRKVQENGCRMLKNKKNWNYVDWIFPLFDFDHKFFSKDESEVSEKKKKSSFPHFSKECLVTLTSTRLV